MDVGGVACTPKKNIRTYLFMGLDAQGETETVDEYVSTGQCDTLQLLVIDETDNTYTRLPLNRDTMTDVNSLDYDGTCLATSRLQLALAHASGDGGAISCENTVDAVSGLLYGQTIDGYASLNMDAIGVLNHLADGVTVTIEDDFSKADPSLKEGETVTLTDEQDVPDALARLRVIYPNLMRLDYDNRRTRAAETPDAAARAESKTPLEHFAAFYEAQNGQPLSDEQAAFCQSLIEDIWKEDEA